jgi:hypothetical protein
MDQPPPQGLPDELMELMENNEPSPFWDYVKYFIIGIIAILFVWFLINPLLGRTKLFKGIKSLPKKLFKNFMIWIKTFFFGLKEFFHILKQGTGGRKIPDAATLRNLEADILAGYSAAKKRDLRRSISIFARLIYWGQEVIKVSWKPSYAPLEYCRVLTQTPEIDRNPAILRTGELFEKALYSADPLTRKERDEFKTLVETVTASC